MTRCKAENGLRCILPEGHAGLHLTGVAKATEDGRLYIVGFGDGYAPRPVRQYVTANTVTVS